MATLHQLESAVLSAVQGVTAAVFANGNLLNVKAAIGWPPEKTIMDVAKIEKHLALISVYDRKIAKDSTRWAPYTLGVTQNPTGITTVVSNDTVAASASVTITLGGTVLPNDAVSAVIANPGAFGPVTNAKVVTGSTGDTPTAMATKLAAAITGDATLSTWVTAVAVGAVVTITNRSSTSPLGIASYAGNVANRTMEVGRRLRQLQIACWARTEEERIALTNPIESMIANISANFGLRLADGTVARILYVNDHDIDDATLNDVLRRDFFVSADYAITSQDVLYSVLAPIPQYAVL